MTRMSIVSLLALACPFLTANAHVGHGIYDGNQVPLSAKDYEGGWASWHMASEHHISNFDPESFFSMHDFDESGTWDAAEIRRTYGLMDESTQDVPEETRLNVVKRVLEMFGGDRDGSVSREDFVKKIGEGISLPDFGLGPGHHGDDEWEYEIHHFEKYHDENTREEDLIHPEDIAHFRKHDLADEEAERQAQLDHMMIVEANIPAKFRINR